MSVPSLFIHSPADGHLGYFQLMNIVNKAAMITLVQVFFEDMFHYTWEGR